MPVLKVAAANAQLALPEVQAVETSQASVMNVGEDIILFNKTGSSITHQNFKTDGEIAMVRGKLDLDFAAVYKATELTYNQINYVRTDGVTNIVIGISEDSYHLTIGNESIGKSNAAATVTLGGLIPRGTYRFTDNGTNQGFFIASENGFYALDTALDRKHVYKIDYIAH